MSVDIQWETLTAGPDGSLLAETVRAFIHDKFQQVTLPRFIRSVEVHSFDFGSIAPEIELKDIGDPLPDFYEDDGDEPDDDDDDDDGQDPPKEDATTAVIAGLSSEQHHRTLRDDISCDSHASSPQRRSAHTDTKSTGFLPSLTHSDLPTSPLVAGSSTPGIPGGTSNLTYFHLPFAPGLSGTTTPLAAVAGAHLHGGWPDNASTIKSIVPPQAGSHQPSTSISSVTPPSSADPSSRPPSQHQHEPVNKSLEIDIDLDQLPLSGIADGARPLLREQSPGDIQVVAHVKYAGNLRLSMTAEILLDYPMPSFVGLPLQLNITGLHFDGVAILAYIKKRAHICFLSPEDAEAFAGQEGALTDATDGSGSRRGRIGGLLEEIKVESEIGQKEPGKQVLKNVGKVEKFILEQVRRIFEDEFVYPSFWTFLV